MLELVDGPMPDALARDALTEDAFAAPIPRRELARTPNPQSLITNP
jgi:hypothetical protein